MSLKDNIQWFVKSRLRPQLAQLVTSPKVRDFKRNKAEKHRAARNASHTVTVFLRLNDAYSYVLLQCLKPLAERFPLEFEFRTVLNLQPDMYPAPELWAKNAYIDCRYLADLYKLDFPQTPPQSNTLRDRQLSAQLLHWELEPQYLDKALALFKAYWQDDSGSLANLVNPEICQHSECYQHHLQANEALLKQQGHYLSAMLYYGGEWYWGLDRLEHLEQRLNTLGINQGQAEVLYTLGHSNFCQTQPAKVESINKNQALEMYWSARSPYSYLGLLRARRLCQHYQIALKIKPVLPMVMRRMQVPKTKGMYIMRDTKREAEKYGLPFGMVADPLGPGVERCYALFAYAEAEGLEAEFAESFARAVWSEGIAAETDRGLKIIVERAGLHWQHAKGLIRDQSWRQMAQDNLADMYAKDLWGVPSFSYGDTHVFGQDRLGLIENAILANNTEPTALKGAKPDSP